MYGFLFRDWLASGLLAAGIVLGGMAVSEPAWPGEAAPKGDLLASGNADMPQAKPQPRPACGIPFEIVSELAGWRVLTGAKAVKYIATAFTTPKPVDSIAFTVHGKNALIVAGLNGCVVGRQVIPAKAHRSFMEKAFGIIA